MKNIQFTDKGGNLVKAGNPVSYATLTDLPKLPLAAIDAIDTLTFTTIDSKLHSYKKSGIFWGADQNELTVVFNAEGRYMEINAANKTAVLFIRDIKTNKMTSFSVVLPSALTASTARRQLAATGSLEGRCSSSACLYTMDEIIMMHGMRPSVGRALGTSAGVVGFCIVVWMVCYELCSPRLDLT